MSPLVPFKYETFRSLWLANLSSSFGALIQGVGAAWLMTSLTSSVDMVALVQASTSLPIMLFSLLGGAVADSFNRRTVLIGAQLFMFTVSVALVVCTTIGLMSPWLLLAFTFLIGCGTAINNPSWQASVGDLVPRHDLPAAVTLNSIGFNLSRSVGPAVGGIIVAAAGAAAAFAINTLSYVALILVLLRWKPEPKVSPLPRERIGAAVFAGLRYVGMSPNIMTVLMRAFIFGFTAIVILALLPLVSAALPDGGPFLYGLMLGAFGVGAICGALSSGRLQSRLGGEAIVRIAFVGFAICAWICALSSSAWLTGFALLLGGASWVLALSLFNVSVQLASPRWVVGRALSLYQTASFGGMALGSWLWGVVGEIYGLPFALGLSAILMLAGAGIGLRLPLPPRLNLDLDPINRFKAPQVELDLTPRSGPIVIEIIYEVAPENVPAFLSAMADRQRVRQRDGARHWRLMRDLANPLLWTETYQTPTWTDYMRHNMRLTKADAEITDRVRALHRGPEPPSVRRYIERPPGWSSAVESKGTIDPH